MVFVLGGGSSDSVLPADAYSVKEVSCIEYDPPLPCPLNEGWLQNDVVEKFLQRGPGEDYEEKNYEPFNPKKREIEHYNDEDELSSKRNKSE